MALNTNIPQPTQTLGQTWNAINQNFNNIEAAFIVNHVDYVDGTGNQGKHILVTMPVNAAPTPTLAGEMSLYTQLVGMVPQLFLQPQTGGTPVNISSVTYQNALPWVFGNQGSTQLPSGVILKWGNATVVNAPITINFSQVFPNNIFAVYATPSSPSNLVTLGGFLQVRSYTTASFIASSNIVNTDFCWFAIGN